MPKREGPDSARRDRLARERMQARKFVWFDGDVTISEISKKGGETRSGDREPPHGRDRPGPGRG